MASSQTEARGVCILDINDFFQLQDKVVVITGANGGVGSACARLFALEAGAEVVLLARSDCSFLVKEIVNNGGSAYFHPTDLLDKDSLRAAFETIEGKYGRVDALLNVAGACEFYSPEDTPLEKMRVVDERWQNIIAINGKAVFDTIELATKMMAPGSTIITISSSAARYGAEMAVSEYSFAKAGIIGLTLSYAKLLAAVGIRVNAIAPGPIEGTAMLSKVRDISIEDMKKKNKLGILAQPDDIASIALFLASPRSRVITGETINANAGQFFSA